MGEWFKKYYMAYYVVSGITAQEFISVWFWQTPRHAYDLAKTKATDGVKLYNIKRVL